MVYQSVHKKLILVAMLGCCVVSIGLPPALAAEDAAVKADQEARSAAEEKNELEATRIKVFTELMESVTLEGAFTTDSSLKSPRVEKYEIVRAAHVSGDRWIIECNFQIRGAKIPIPVPVEVRWAGDTPMIQVTDLSIPLVGDGFSARVLFYGDRYAGTWQHNEKGGHLFGTLTRTAK